MGAATTKGNPMTDARLPERWLNDRRFRSKRLSDAGYRSYINALVWSVANRTDGVIERGDLEDIPDFNPAVVQELMGDDLWEPLGAGDRWRISDFETTQTGRDLLESVERRRAWDRKRKAKDRKNKLAELADDESGGNSGGRSPADSYSTGQASTGQDYNAGRAPKSAARNSRGVTPRSDQ
jgi:hypothetical protein